MQAANPVAAPPPPRKQRDSKFVLFVKKNYVGYLFLLPFLVLFSVFVVAPVFVAIFISFTNYNMLQPASFVGINNYRLLFLDDEVFLIALQNTLMFALVVGPVGYIMSFMAAWVINQLKFRNVFALAFYAPSITSATAISIMWLFVFSGDRFGFLNNWLIRLGLITVPIQWTTNPDHIMQVVIFVAIWMSMGTGFLVFLAGLQNINKEYYEAGSLDGIRTGFQELYYLTLPMMKPQLLFGAITSIVSSFAVFDIAVSIAGMPSPNYAAHTIVAHLFDYAFIRFQMGYASSIAVVLFLITFILGRVVFRLLKSDE